MFSLLIGTLFAKIMHHKCKPDQKANSPRFSDKWGQKGFQFFLHSKDSEKEMINSLFCHVIYQWNNESRHLIAQATWNENQLTLRGLSCARVLGRHFCKTCRDTDNKSMPLPSKDLARSYREAKSAYIDEALLQGKWLGFGFHCWRRNVVSTSPEERSETAHKLFIVFEYVSPHKL